MLKLENITYKKNGKTILDNINLNIESGKLFVITGPNGSGKSTLAKIIMGLIKPTNGKIILNDKDITNLPIHERANLGISYAFQTPVTFKGLTVKNLFDAVKKDTEFETIKSYLRKVGLCAREYINRDFDDTLSGGERKRIEIALILYKNGILNIFDEPEAGIDLWSFDNLIKIFKKKNKKKTTIIISHQEKILNIADEIILLNNGKIIDKGPKENMLPKLLDKKVSCRKADYLGGVQNGTK